MATTSSTYEINTEDYNMSSSTTSSSIIDEKSNELQVTPILQCFVCDAIVKGRYYALATCKTQNTRSRVIEKLGELVGESYMVVISEDDVICRSCANLINTLDKLEIEIRNVRENVLRFLEQKYSLKEGELLNNSEKPKLSQPPQITRNTGNYFKNNNAVLSINASEYNKTKKNVWMQCDTCKYTTHHNSFMAHHMRDHIKQEVFCDKCGMQFSDEQQKLNHECDIQKHEEEMETLNEEESEKEICAEDTNETLVKIEDFGKIPDIENSDQEDISMLPLHAYSQLHIPNENIPIIRLSNPENYQLPNILEHDEISTSDQPMYVRVLQHVNVNDNFMHSSELPSTSNDVDMVIKVKDSSTKQLLTLTEDGSLEIVEVACWDDVQPGTSDPDTEMHF